MNPQHEAQVNAHYRPMSVICWQSQLQNALRAALATEGAAATHWVAQVEQLVGRIALSHAGGTIRDAAKFIEITVTVIEPEEVPCPANKNPPETPSPKSRSNPAASQAVLVGMNLPTGF